MMTHTFRVALVAVGLAAGIALPAHAQSTSDAVDPPRDIVFRDPFVGRDGEIVDPSVPPPDSLVFRPPFVARDGELLDPFVEPPRGLVFRQPFVGRDEDGTTNGPQWNPIAVVRPDVEPPQGIVFREPFLSREGVVTNPDVAAPEGLVFRDVFLDRDGPATAAPSTAPVRLIERASVLPNPFNPSTQISFRISREAEVSVAVYDARGRHVRTVHRGVLAADLHVMTWNGNDTTDAPVASGVYFFRIAAGAETVVVKGVLVE